MIYHSIQDLLNLAKEYQIPLWEVVCRADMEERQVTKEQSFETMHRMYEAMKQADSAYDKDLKSASGLAGGGGIAFLIRRFELNFRVRYSFGYSDIVRNRNKYYDNNSDGAENPFWATPLRSPLDNLMISVGLNYRFNKQGFEAWKPRPKKEKNREVFKFGL